MKFSNKIVEEVVQEVAGEDVIPLVNILKNRKNVSEFKLAEDIKQEINTTRNMLYRLYDANLVSFTRKKDKKKGWYIYYWTFNAKRIKYLFNDLKKKKLEQLKERLDREKNNHFFSCDSKCMRLDFEQATEFEFKCPECGSLMNEESNLEKIAKLEKEIKELEKVAKA
jgi:transcription initiation factor TFIIE subunit alpha